MSRLQTVVTVLLTLMLVTGAAPAPLDSLSATAPASAASSDTVVMCGDSTGWVAKYDYDGSSVDQLWNTSIDGCNGIETDSGNVYVIDTANKLYKIDGETGNITATISGDNVPNTVDGFSILNDSLFIGHNGGGGTWGKGVVKYNVTPFEWDQNKSISGVRQIATTQDYLVVGTSSPELRTYTEDFTFQHSKSLNDFPNAMDGTNASNSVVANEVNQDSFVKYNASDNTIQKRLNNDTTKLEMSRLYDKITYRDSTTSPAKIHTIDKKFNHQFLFNEDKIGAVAWSNYLWNSPSDVSEMRVYDTDGTKVHTFTPNTSVSRIDEYKGGGSSTEETVNGDTDTFDRTIELVDEKDRFKQYDPELAVYRYDGDGQPVRSPEATSEGWTQTETTGLNWAGEATVSLEDGEVYAFTLTADTPDGRNVATMIAHYANESQDSALTWQISTVNASASEPVSVMNNGGSTTVTYAGPPVSELNYTVEGENGTITRNRTFDEPRSYYQNELNTSETNLSDDGVERVVYEGEWENGTSFNGSTGVDVGNFSGSFGPTGSSSSGGGGPAGSPLVGGAIAVGGAALAYQTLGNGNLGELSRQAAETASKTINRVRGR